jgi:choline-sulfatase
LKWLADHAKDENSFLYVNYWGPRTPYRTPDEFGNPFAQDPLPEWITEEVLEKHKKKIRPHSVNEINMAGISPDKQTK